MLSQDEWESVLKLTTKWKMLALRKQAVNQLSALSLTAPKRILLGREYGIVEWLRTGYIDLAIQAEPWSMDEFRALKLENALLLSQQIRRPYQVSGKKTVPHDIDVSLKQVIDNALQPSLAGQMQSKFSDNVERILFAQSSSDSVWLYAAYGDLAKRGGNITVAEAERLGLETTLSICRMREKLSYPDGVPLRPCNWVGDVGYHMDSVFCKELADVREAGEAYIEKAPPALKNLKKKLPNRKIGC